MAQVPLNRLISLPTLAFMTLPFATDTTTAQSPVNEPMYVYVGKNGSNASACIQSADSPCTSMIGPVCFAVEKPCLTIQGAIGKVPYEKRGSVFISPGTYSESVNVVGDLHHRVEIYGPYSFEGGNYRCVDPSQVVIAAPGDTAIWAQDHATVIVGCLTLGPANVGVAARQFVILDVAETRFDNVATSIVLSERSMATCGSRIWVTSSGSYVASVHRSDLNYACQTIIAAGLSFTAFFNADKKSTIDTTGASYTNTISGQKWILNGSEIGPDCVVPGSGTTQSNFSVAPSC